MSKPVLQSVALASLAAGTLGTATASTLSPSFSCLPGADATAGGTVSWGDFSTVTAPTLGFDFLDEPDVVSSLDCSGGGFSEGVAARKSGEGQKEFFKVTLKEVFLSGYAPANTTDHIKFKFTQVLGALVDGVQTYESYWDITGDYRLSNFDGGFTPFTQFLGFKLQTGYKFAGESALKYDYASSTLLFSAELPEQPGVLSLTATPRTVSEPGTLVLLGTGLAGAAALRRRRRAW